MKTFVRMFVCHAVVLLPLAVICQIRLVLADDLCFISTDQQSAALAGEEKAVDKGQSACTSCVPDTCCLAASSGSCCCSDLGCDACPGRGIVGFFGLDSFKGVSDGENVSNFGEVTGLNASMPVPWLSDYGIGWQLGMSYGVYDFDGRLEILAPAKSQQQIFITTGFFRKAKDCQRISCGMVYDWMINDNWGEFGTDPTLGQWRGQIEYALTGCNAVGAWGCVRDLNSRQTVLIGVVQSRAISQANLFWHHKFDMDADSWLWVGFPERTTLGFGGGSLGDWMVGATMQAPLSDRLALYANGSYFRPSAAAGVPALIENGYDVSMGIVWYFGRHAVSHSINGACWLPYMPVANNSTFLVDQSPSFIF